MDRGVDTERDEVAEAINGASEEIEARAKIGDGGRSEGSNGGENGFRFGGCDDGQRKVTAKDVWFFRIKACCQGSCWGYGFQRRKKTDCHFLL